MGSRIVLFDRNRNDFTVTHGPAPSGNRIDFRARLRVPLGETLILLSQTESPRRSRVARDSAHGRD
jgi:hypothetical protein